MKKLILALTLILVNVFSFAQGFTVRNFTADIYLSREGYFDVVEKYDIEFTEAKHGFFRDIITKFDFKDENGKMSKREIYISDVAVPGQPFKTNEIFGKQFGDKLTIKIGDKDKLVSGNQHYEIHYRVKNALIFTDSLVQFYWNIKPSEWLAVFNAVNFTIHTPDGATLSPENSFVYSGNTGNTEPSTEFDYDYTGNTFSGRSKDGFYSVPGQNVTVLVKLPKATIQEADFAPPFWQRYAWIGILILIYLVTHTLFRIYGKPQKVIATTSYYPPKGMDPAMAGILIDNIPDGRDILSLLPYWATKGIIRMEEIEKGERSLKGDLKLIKCKALPEDVPGYEYAFFNKVFSSSAEMVLASSLSNVIYEPQMLLMKKFKAFFQKPKSPAKRNWGCFVGLWALGGSVLCFFIWGWIAAVVNLIVCMILSIMLLTREKNQQGNAAFSELLGFKQFIKMAEAERIKTLLKDDPNYFEKTMPYAVAFNLLKEWTGKFEGLLSKSPDWYTSSTGTHFTMNTFAHSFSSSMKTASASMVTSPSSGSSSSHSGGGSSGGGAGSGGGGSW